MLILLQVTSVCICKFAVPGGVDRLWLFIALSALGNWSTSKFGGELRGKGWIWGISEYLNKQLSSCIMFTRKKHRKAALMKSQN